MPQSNIKLEDKLFNIVTIVSLLIAVINIIENSMINFPFEMNIKWVFIIMICLALIKFNKSEIITQFLRLCYFLCVILVIIPIGWIESGGSSNNAITYIFLVMICIIFFFKKKTRAILILLLISTFQVLLCLEYFFPEIIKMHNYKTQFLDRFIQVPLALISGYLLLKQFANAYIMEEEKQYIANDIYVILFDIDYFKSINDIYGHSIGDKVLCLFAKEAGSAMPETSLVSRWGGDEFAIIYFGALEELEIYMSRLQRSIKNMKISEEQKVTISSGITLINKNDTISEVFKRMDKALYKSKNRGRNQYTIL